MAATAMLVLSCSSKPSNGGVNVNSNGGVNVNSNGGVNVNISSNDSNIVNINSNSSNIVNINSSYIFNVNNSSSYSNIAGGSKTLCTSFVSRVLRALLSSTVLIRALFSSTRTVLIRALFSSTVLIRALLSSTVLTYVGDRSYSVYLWHWPCLVLLKHYASFSGMIEGSCGGYGRGLLWWV